MPCQGITSSSFPAVGQLLFRDRRFGLRDSAYSLFRLFFLESLDDSCTIDSGCCPLPLVSCALRSIERYLSVLRTLLNIRLTCHPLTGDEYPRFSRTIAIPCEGPKTRFLQGPLSETGTHR